MQIQIESQPLSAVSTDALVSYAFEKDNKFTGALGEIDNAMNGRLATLANSGEFTGRTLETLLMHFPEGMTARRLLLIGAGKPGKFEINDLRRIVGTALRYLKSRGVQNFAFLAREGERGPEAAQAVVEGLIAADFESDKYRSEKKKKEIQLVSLLGFDPGLGAGLTSAVEHGQVIAESQNFARDLINEPSNKLTPRMLAAKAEAMAKEAGLGVEILDERKIAELKMGALLSVAQGSFEPPRVIVLRYTPASATAGSTVLGLVGKGVTFDTGGISIKPANNMEKMKYDMGGGATMIGVMRALAALKPSVPVIAVIPATENMPGGRAQKPGDVQVAMSGKTIEVINTDAEGRLILADGVT
ncbi:MAG: leucyl aminopeptidase family protein, partial [Candidatus Binataceae bacterium]